MNLTGLFTNNSIYSISIFYQENGIKIHVLLVRKNKSEFKIEQEISIDNLDDLFNHLNPSIPLVLFIGGDKVILKKINKNIKSKDEIFSQMPGIKAEDFISDYKNFSDYSFIAILRKTEFLTLKELFNKSNIMLVSFELIPFFDNEIIKTNENEYDLIFYGGYQLEVLGKNITRIENASSIFNYEISNFKIDSTFLASYFTALSYFKSTTKQINFEFTDLENYKFKNRNIKFLTFSIIFLISIFIVSSFMNQRYTEKLTVLQISRKHQIKEKTLLDSINNEINKLNELVKNKQGERSNQMTFIADRIGSIVPDNILLTDLQIFPSKTKNNKLELNDKTILIFGRSLRNLALTEFLTKLKGFSWVKSAKISEYQKDMEKGYANFSINIDFNYEKLN